MFNMILLRDINLRFRIAFDANVFTLQTLNEYGYFEVAIISDANTVFIEHILYRQGVRHLVHEVFSNYAQFDGNGCLTIQEFHRNDWCKMCPQNLCKSKVVADYIDRRKKQGVNLNR